jgi:hypothetical protein
MDKAAAYMNLVGLGRVAGTVRVLRRVHVATPHPVRVPTSPRPTALVSHFSEMNLVPVSPRSPPGAHRVRGTGEARTWLLEIGSPRSRASFLPGAWRSRLRPGLMAFAFEQLRACGEIVARRARVTGRVTVLETQRNLEGNVVEAAGVEGHDVDAPRRSR